MAQGADNYTLRRRAYRQLFAHAGDGGRLSAFNRFMIVVILLAVAISVIGTEAVFENYHPDWFYNIEFGFGVIFLGEYLGRVWTIAEAPGNGPAWKKRLRFILSPLALLDLVVVVAALAPLFVTDAAILRSVRLIRLFALAKFGRFSHALQELGEAVHSRRYELSVTVALAGCLVLFGATALYWAEHSVQPEKFGSIPRALYWAVITLTTIGYGDVTPVTPIGKMLAAVVAVGGIALVAMPTGIMAAAFSETMHRRHQEELERKLEADFQERVDEEVDRLVEEEERRRE